MDFIEVDQTTCTQCGLCATDCPSGIIFFREGGYPKLFPRAEPFCLKCGHCVAVCPTGSLDHRDVPLKESAKIDSALKISAEQAEQLIKGRRSVRTYRDQPVARETIARLIDTARFAPTGHNNEEVEWLVVDDRAILQRLEQIGTDWFRSIIENQPQMATAMNIAEALKRQEKRHDTFLRGAPVLIVAHSQKDNPLALVDSSIALGYFDLAANALGLACCWAGFVYFMATSYPPMIEALAIPEGNAAYGCLMLGYPGHRYTRIPQRKPARIVWQGGS